MVKRLRPHLATTHPDDNDVHGWTHEGIQVSRRSPNESPQSPSPIRMPRTSSVHYQKPHGYRKRRPRPFRKTFHPKLQVTKRQTGTMLWWLLQEVKTACCRRTVLLSVVTVLRSSWYQLIRGGYENTLYASPNPQCTRTLLSNIRNHQPAALTHHLPYPWPPASLCDIAT